MMMTTADRRHGGHDDDAMNEVMVNLVANALHMIGAISLLGFAMDEEEDFREYECSARSSSSASSSSSAPLLHVKYGLSDAKKRFKTLFPSALTSLIELAVLDTLPAVDSASSSSSSCSSVTRRNAMLVRAHAIVTMGKACMRSKALSREYVNVFLRELQHHDDGDDDAQAAVRSNALMVLGDMCIRYTNLVERHIDTLAASLQDRSLLVRRNAFLVITQVSE